MKIRADHGNPACKLSKHAKLLCRVPLFIEFVQIVYFAFVSRVAYAGCWVLGLSYADAIDVFFASETLGQDLLDLYWNSQPYLPVGDGTMSIIYELCILGVLLVGLVNLITFHFVNAPLRKARKAKKKEKDEEIG